MFQAVARSDRYLPTSLRERWYALRAHLLASEKFQKIAANMPISRGIARRQAQDIFDLVAGFVYSQILLACVRLRLFEHLRHGPRTIIDLCNLMQLDQSACERLLTAASSLRLVTKLSGNRYCLGFRGAAIAGNPGVLRMIEHHALLYRDLSDPVALLRSGSKTELSKYWAYCSSEPGELDDDRVAAYTNLMSRTQTLITSQVLDAYRFDGHSRVLDVGGGDGTFLLNVAARAPNLDLVLFDVPAVAARACQRFADANLSARAEAVGGDFLTDALPSGADLVTLVRVVHDHDDDAVMSLLRRIRAAIADNGTLLIAEPMSGVASAEAVGDAYFGFYLMAMGSGRARTVQELAGMLTKAGFGSVVEKKTALPLQCKVLVARVVNKNVKLT